MEDAIDGRAREQVVVEDRAPLLDGAVRGKDRRAMLISVADDLVEVHRLFVFQRAEAKVVDDEQGGAGVGREVDDLALRSLRVEGEVRRPTGG